MKNKKFSPRSAIGMVTKVVVIAAVLMFLGVQSYAFFGFIFPDDKWYVAMLGFGLTSGGVVAYLIMLKTDAKTPLQKTVAAFMMAVSLIGEMATAAFGMQIEGWREMGYTMTSSEFDWMIIVITGLGILHGLASVVYIAGEDIAELFADEDGDGIPNFADKDYTKKQRAYAEDVSKPDPTKRQ